MELDDTTKEQLRLGAAARAALAESESRWRHERGASAAERMRLRSEISTLMKGVMKQPRSGQQEVALRTRRTQHCHSRCDARAHHPCHICRVESLLRPLLTLGSRPCVAGLVTLSQARAHRRRRG